MPDETKNESQPNPPQEQPKAAEAPRAEAPHAESKPAEPRPHSPRPSEGRPRSEGRGGDGRGGESRGPRDAGREGGKRGRRGFFRKKKVCRFCVDRVDYIDYKKPEQLMTFIQERGKIVPRRITGTCSRHQRWLAEAIKRARNIALMPFGGVR